MTNKKSRVRKSCGPKLFDDSEPGHEWGLDELGKYAQMQYQEIVDGETWLATAYWRLGLALELAKKSFTHGQWERHLEELRIDKTRASKARAIHRTFDSPEDVADLTVEEAYGQRQRRQPSTQSGPDGPVPTKQCAQRVRRSVGMIGQRAEKTIDAAAFAEPEDAVALIPTVRQAIRQLETLLQCLEDRASAAEPDAEPAPADDNGGEP